MCLSVCLLHAGIVSKRLNLGSRKRHTTTVVFVAKMLAKFERGGLPLTGARNVLAYFEHNTIADNLQQMNVFKLEPLRLRAHFYVAAKSPFVDPTWRRNKISLSPCSALFQRCKTIGLID